MLFSSITFIYYFLPIFLIFYFICPNKYKNIILLFFSLLFYFLGEPKYIIVLILSCLINYFLSKLIYKSSYSKLYLIVAILYNVIQLLIFKYTDFFISNINSFFNLKLPLTYIVMPIGISFYTFQVLSYVIDVYYKKYKPARNIIDFMTYLCLFPQLVAGPIVRYSSVLNDLYNRKTSYEKFSNGIKRFIIGLAKKVLIANCLKEVFNSILVTSYLDAFLSPFIFTLQIYFDFSGYSDMAIGLGLMIGFSFPENFNYPLFSTSITNFWRKWHISLSSFFKDYIYIPLGGNRVSKLKWIRNIFVVWFLTGFWHGASWNFIIWGLYFAVILVIEKLFLKNIIEKTKVFKYLYSFILIVISFLIFNKTDLKDLLFSLKSMFFLNDLPLYSKLGLYYLKSNLILILLSLLFITPLLPNLIKKIKSSKIKKVLDILEIIFYLLLLTLVTAFLIDESFNPFLYFRF